MTKDTTNDRKHAPIFLFSNWRTGGTALAFAFRKSPAFHVYTEPFNPTLHNPDLARRAQTTDWPSKHPPGERYFTEFEDFFGKDDFVFPRFEDIPYVLNAEDECPPLEDYLRALIDHAQQHGRTPVFKLEQGEGAAPWFAAKFPEAVRIGLSRNRVAQLVSWMEQASNGNHLFFSLAHKLIHENVEFFGREDFSQFIVGDVEGYEAVFNLFRNQIETQHSAFMHFCLDVSPESPESIEQQLDRVKRFDAFRLDLWESTLRYVRSSLAREPVIASKLSDLKRLIAAQRRLEEMELQSQRAHDLEEQIRHLEAHAGALETELENRRSVEEAAVMDLLAALMHRFRLRLGALMSRLRKSRASQSANDVFERIYSTNYWRGESRSGQGSDLIQTAIIRKEIPKLLEEFSIKSMVDVPCGDFYWMKEVKLPVNYIGADIVTDMIRVNDKEYGNDLRKFRQLDVCKDELPCVDLVFSRDLLVHLSYEDIRRALQNMKESGSTWLLTTTFTGRNSNTDIPTGDWRTLNLELPPFNFPAPVRLINEGCTQFDGDYNDKSLGLWKLQDLVLWQ